METDMRYVYGIDIGGTTVKIGRFSDRGELLHKFEIPTRTEDAGEHILPDIKEAVLKDMEEASLSREDLAGVGVDMPGPVDRGGLVHKAANLGWGEFNVRDRLAELFGENLSLEVLNDANAAALGEMRSGAGKGYRDILVVTLGTGIGGGIITNGEILTGARGSGGEIGHFHLTDGETESCGCGNKGCFEQYCSATGLVRMAKRYLEEHEEEDSALRGTEVTAKSIFDEKKKGDSVASKIASEYGHLLGKGLAVIASILDPEVILIGGGVSKAGPVLIDLLRDSYRENAFNTAKDTKIDFCVLGNDAGIYGAAGSVLKGINPGDAAVEPSGGKS